MMSVSLETMLVARDNYALWELKRLDVEMHTSAKHSNLLGQFVSYKENEVLWLRLQATGHTVHKPRVVFLPLALPKEYDF
jgi:hypothetical protein